MKYRVKTEDGLVFGNLKDAMRHFGYKYCPGQKTYQQLAANGSITYKGNRITLLERIHGNTIIKNDASVCAKPNTLLEKLQERYTMQELQEIAKGQGIQRKYIPYPEIHLQGKHHRVVVISDTHIGSVYSPEEWHDVVANFVNDPDNEVDCVLHCGDIVDGLKTGREMQIYELTDIGYDAQLQKAVRIMRKYRKTVYIISGNHDMYFKASAGANIVKAICDAVPNMVYIGHDNADIDIDGCKLRLFHGGDGNSYALSYRLQKLVEAITGGNKPNILLAGHVHKFCYIFERNIHAISVPSMQSQTSFMRSRKLAAHTGFLVLDFDTMSGEVCNMSVKFYPFYA